MVIKYKKPKPKNKNYQTPYSNQKPFVERRKDNIQKEKKLGNVFNVVTVSLLVLIAAITLYFQYFRVKIEADLIVTSVEQISEMKDYNDYSIKFKINNSGNQSLSAVNAVLFATGLNPNTPEKPLLIGKNFEQLDDAEIAGGQISTFKFKARVDRTLIKQGIDFEKMLDPTKISFKGVMMPVKVQVIIYSADRNYMIAQSNFLLLKYSNGKEMEIQKDGKTIDFVKLTKPFQDIIYQTF